MLEMLSIRQRHVTEMSFEPHKKKIRIDFEITFSLPAVFIQTMSDIKQTLTKGLHFVTFQLAAQGFLSVSDSATVELIPKLFFC